MNKKTLIFIFLISTISSVFSQLKGWVLPIVNSSHNEVPYIDFTGAEPQIIFKDFDAPFSAQTVGNGEYCNNCASSPLNISNFIISGFGSITYDKPLSGASGLGTHPVGIRYERSTCSSGSTGGFEQTVFMNGSEHLTHESLSEISVGNGPTAGSFWIVSQSSKPFGSGSFTPHTAADFQVSLFDPSQPQSLTAKYVHHLVPNSIVTEGYNEQVALGVEFIYSQNGPNNNLRGKTCRSIYVSGFNSVLVHFILDVQSFTIYYGSNMSFSNLKSYNSALETSFPDATNNNHPKYVASSGFNGVFMMQLDENGYLMTNQGIESFNTVNHPIWSRGACYGAEFDPESNYLYYIETLSSTSKTLKRFHTSTFGAPANIIDNVSTFSNAKYISMESASNGNIYFTKRGSTGVITSLSEIQSPHLAAIPMVKDYSSMFTDNGIDINAKYTFGNGFPDWVDGEDPLESNGTKLSVCVELKCTDLNVELQIKHDNIVIETHTLLDGECEDIYVCPGISYDIVINGDIVDHIPNLSTDYFYQYSDINKINSAVLSGGSDTLCEGSTKEIKAPGITGSLYEWFLNGTSVSGPTLNDSIYSVHQSGSYHAKITGNIGHCDNSTDTAKFLFTSKPTISLVDTITCPDNVGLFYYAPYYSDMIYNWSVVTNLPFETDSNQIKYDISSTEINITLTITDTIGCESTPINASINLNALITTAISPKKSVCAGDTVTYSVQNDGGYYDWDIYHALDTTTLTPTSIQVIFGDTLVDILVSKITDGATCLAGDSIRIEVNQLPIPVLINPNVLLCPNSDAIYAVKTTTGSTYSWDVISETFSPNNSTVNITDIQSDFTVKVTEEDINGCVGVSDTTVVVVLIAPIEITGRLDVCIKTSETYSSTNNGGTIIWDITSGAGILTNNTNDLTDIEFPSTGTVKITVEETINGCVVDTTYEVTVHPNPIIDISTNLSTCLQDGLVPITVSETAGVLSGIGTLGFSFDPLTPGVLIAQDNWIYLNYTNQFGCTSIDSTSIMVYQEPEPVIDILNSVVCANQTTSIFETSVTIGSKTWFKNTAQMNITDTLFTAGEGEYYLVVEDNGCIESSNILIVSEEIISIDIGDDIKVEEGQPINLSANYSVDAESIVWLDHLETIISDNSYLDLVAYEDACFDIILKTTLGCEAKEQVCYEIISPIVPMDMFTPNGDNLNPVWVIENIQDYPNTVVEIYNRWGNIVFKSNNYQNDWDGTRNGKPVPAAVYYYVIDLMDDSNPIHGALTILY